MKHKSKKVVSLILCFSLLFIGTKYITKSKAAVSTYTDSGRQYTSKQILSDYQYFTKSCFKADNHFAGALACGGMASFNSFGNGAIVPSYVKHILHSGNYSGQYDSHYLANYPKYKNLLEQPAYYKTALTLNSSLTEYPDKSGSYIDFKKAFNSLKAESEALSKNSVLKLSNKNLKWAKIDNQSGYLLTIPFSASVKSVYIPFNVLLKTDWILIDGVEDLDELVSTEHVITLDRYNTLEIGGDYSYVQSGDSKKAVFISTKNNDGKTFSFQRSLSYQKAYLLDDAHGLKSLKKSETIEAGQMDLSGMKLIWNFPDNDFLTCSYLPGHVLAPNALVTINGGCFEGGYIADSILNYCAEGHFYPYREIPESSEEPSVTATVKPTVSAPPSAVPAPSAVPCPTPSATPAPSPTPSVASSSTPAAITTPTVTPTVTATTKPTASVTPSAVLAPSAVPCPTPSATPAPSPTPSVASSSTPAAITTPDVTPTVTATTKPTTSVTPSAAPTSSAVPTPTASVTPSVAPSSAPTAITTPDVTPTVTATAKPVIKAKYPPADEPKLPSNQKGSPSTGEKNQTLPFILITIISGLGILFFTIKLTVLKKNDKYNI